MPGENITISHQDLAKLLAAASGDAALLYLHLKAGKTLEEASKALNLAPTRLECAGATLRQLGLWQKEEKCLISGQRPDYTERDVIIAMEEDRDFKALYGEIQQRLGRSLNTEELKIILGFIRYLGLHPQVVCILISYCKDRARQQGKLRTPSLRTIEKEAYAWAEQGIDTLEEAAAFIQRQNQRNSRLGRLMQLLQIRGRNLTPGEERYALSWLEMDFPEAVLSEAYQRTCLNTGGMNWAYMNRILTRWQEAGLRTLQDIQTGDTKKKNSKPGAIPKGASGTLGAAELEAIAKLLKEES